MESGFWIAFWILFVFFACIGFRPIFWIPFCTFLILMRTTENQMSQNSWVAFWLIFLLIHASLWIVHDPVEHISSTVILFMVRYFIPSPYEMPTAAFWVLFALLLPPSSRGLTKGSFVSCAVVIFNCHLNSDGVHLPRILISYFALGVFCEITLVTIIIVKNIARYPYYVSAMLLWIGFAGLLHHQIWPWNEDLAGYGRVHGSFHSMRCFLPSHLSCPWSGTSFGLESSSVWASHSAQISHLGGFIFGTSRFLYYGACSLYLISFIILTP